MHCISSNAYSLACLYYNNYGLIVDYDMNDNLFQFDQDKVASYPSKLQCDDKKEFTYNIIEQQIEKGPDNPADVKVINLSNFINACILSCEEFQSNKPKLKQLFSHIINSKLIQSFNITNNEKKNKDNNNEDYENNNDNENTKILNYILASNILVNQKRNISEYISLMLQFASSTLSTTSLFLYPLLLVLINKKFSIKDIMSQFNSLSNNDEINVNAINCDRKKAYGQIVITDVNKISKTSIHFKEKSIPRITYHDDDDQNYGNNNTKNNSNNMLIGDNAYSNQGIINKFHKIIEVISKISKKRGLDESTINTILDMLIEAYCDIYQFKFNKNRDDIAVLKMIHKKDIIYQQISAYPIKSDTAREGEDKALLSECIGFQKSHEDENQESQRSHLDKGSFEQNNKNELFTLGDINSIFKNEWIHIARSKSTPNSPLKKQVSDNMEHMKLLIKNYQEKLLDYEVKLKELSFEKEMEYHYMQNLINTITTEFRHQKINLQYEFYKDNMEFYQSKHNISTIPEDLSIENSKTYIISKDNDVTEKFTSIEFDKIDTSQYTLDSSKYNTNTSNYSGCDKPIDTNRTKYYSICEKNYNSIQRSTTNSNIINHNETYYQSIDQSKEIEDHQNEHLNNPSDFLKFKKESEMKENDNNNRWNNTLYVENNRQDIQSNREILNFNQIRGREDDEYNENNNENKFLSRNPDKSAFRFFSPIDTNYNTIFNHCNTSNNNYLQIINEENNKRMAHIEETNSVCPGTIANCAKTLMNSLKSNSNEVANMMDNNDELNITNINKLLNTTDIGHMNEWNYKVYKSLIKFKYDRTRLLEAIQDLLLGKKEFMEKETQIRSIIMSSEKELYKFIEEMSREKFDLQEERQNIDKLKNHIIRENQNLTLKKDQLKAKLKQFNQQIKEKEKIFIQREIYLQIQNKNLESKMQALEEEKIKLDYQKHELENYERNMKKEWNKLRLDTEEVHMLNRIVVKQQENFKREYLEKLDKIQIEYKNIDELRIKLAKKKIKLDKLKKKIYDEKGIMQNQKEILEKEREFMQTQYHELLQFKSKMKQETVRIFNTEKQGVELNNNSENIVPCLKVNMNRINGGTKPKHC